MLQDSVHIVAQICFIFRERHMSGESRQTSIVGAKEDGNEKGQA